MPELPDIETYLHALRSRVAGQTLQRIRIASPFLVRSVDPPISSAHGKQVRELERLGKRIVFGLSDDLFLVMHLMIAGRLRWKEPGAALSSKIALAAFDFPTGTLLLTEAGTKKRASLFLLSGREQLEHHDPGGLDVLATDLAAFEAALTRENHTLKRVLTDPQVFSGIGNAYSDEILHRAKLSPILQTRKMSSSDVERLFEATVAVLRDWTQRLLAETGERFPEKVTAFREGMAVHGRFGKPCPICGSPVQRIVHAENETNYCATCQTGGRLLADRALSQLLKKDWPKSLEDMEEKVHRMKRREFLGAAAGLALTVRAPALPPWTHTAPRRLKLSLAAFSLRQFLTLQNGAPGAIDLHGFLDYCQGLDLGGAELTSYYFPSEVTPEYLCSLKRHAHRLGLTISGGAIRNDFCQPAGEGLTSDLAHTQRWIDFYADLGAPVIRVFAGNVPAGENEDAVIARCVEHLRRACDMAGKRGVMLALENHGGITAKSATMLKIVQAVDSPWFGVNLDSGNFTSGPDPYAELSTIAPFSINVQVKIEVTIDGRKQPADYARIFKILREAKYSGWVVLEYEGEADPYQAIPEHLERMRAAIG